MALQSRPMNFSACLLSSTRRILISHHFTLSPFLYFFLHSTQLFMATHNAIRPSERNAAPAMILRFGSHPSWKPHRGEGLRQSGDRSRRHRVRDYLLTIVEVVLRSQVAA